MEKMTIVPEKGTMLLYHTPTKLAKFYYDHVGWYNGFKFVFGKFVGCGDNRYYLYEVSTKSCAATPTESRSTTILCADFYLKLGAKGNDLGRVVEQFFNRASTNKRVIPLWLSTLIG